MSEKYCKDCRHWDRTPFSVTDTTGKGRCDLIESFITVDIETKPVGTPTKVSYYFTTAKFSCKFWTSRLEDIDEGDLKFWDKALSQLATYHRQIRRDLSAPNKEIHQELSQKLNDLRNLILNKIKS